MAFRWEHFVNTFDTRTIAYGNGGPLDSHGSKHTHYVREFASIVSEFQDRTDGLVDLYADLSRTIDELKTCAYTSEAFSTHLAAIQKVIDNLNLEGYANLDTWVRDLDKKVEGVLVDRLRTTIDRWCTEFSKEADNGGSAESSLLARKKAIAAKLVSTPLSLSKNLREIAHLASSFARLERLTMGSNSRRSFTKFESRTKSSTSVLRSKKRERAGMDSYSNGSESFAG